MDKFRLLNGNGGVINTYKTLAGAQRIQKYYEGSKLQELVNGEWEDA